MARSLQLVAAACAAATAAAWKDPGDGFVLKLFDAGSSAICLDGSMGGYYARPGSDTSTWLIELEGGGWCVSDADCLGRSSTDIGSSKNWPATGSPTMDGGSHGLFSTNCTINPHFCNASMIHANYCDGASFAGHLDVPWVVAANATTNVTLYSRGRDILDETLRYAVQREGMSKASVVMLKGCSAGGLATILHADYVSEVLKASIPGVQVVAVPDAGVFLDHTTVAGEPYYTPLYQWVAQRQNVTQPGSVDDGCLASYPPDQSWKCFMAQYTLPFVTTPLFIAQDLDDSWQMTNIFRLPCSPSANSPGNCNATELAWMDSYRLATLSALGPAINSGVHGGFITTCVQHCHSNIDYCFDAAQVQGQTMVDTLAAWYNQVVHGIAPPAGTKTMVIDGTYGHNPTCTPSCSPY